MTLFPRRISALFAALSVAALTAAALAQGAASTIPVDEIRPGMRGYGLSVFRGTQPERFDVEVIDVLHNFRPDQDLILVRTPHPMLDRAIAVGGMSGSPIYLEGRLAGAYAYGWPFGIEPVVGVTPIADMMAEIDRPVRPDSFPGARPLAQVRGRARTTPAQAAMARLGGVPAFRGEGPVSAFDPLAAHAARLGFEPGRAPTGPVPASTPVMLGGLTDDVARILGDTLEPFGLVTFQAGGGARRPRRTTRAQASATPRPQFVDGGSLGVALVRGDISATAIGTVTHVVGPRLVGFGHPMMNAGEVGLPASTARVLHVLQSQSRSFKIAEAEEPLGTLIHDRQSAVVVDTNLVAGTVPVTVRLHGVANAPRTEWNVEVASHRALTPALTFAALLNAVRAAAADSTDVHYRAVSRVTLEGRAPIELEDEGYMSSGPGDARALSSLRAFELMEVGFGNPFEPSRVERVEIDLHLEYTREVLRILDASVGVDEVDPGSVVNVRVTTRMYDQQEQTRVIPVSIPRRAAGETIEIQIAGAGGLGPEHGTPRTVDDLLEIVRDRYPATSIAVSLKMPSRGLRYRGHVVTALPASALDALAVQNGSEPGRPIQTYERELVPAGHVVAGTATLSLRVRETPR